MTDCIIWTGARSPYGYGQKWHNGRLEHRHRLEWMLQRGPIPKGMCVLHRCDNPPCYNIYHLFLGTKAENSADMAAKGRHCSRTGRGMATLNPEKVHEIRERRACGEPALDLAAEFGVSKWTIWKVAGGQSWAAV